MATFIKLLQSLARGNAEFPTVENDEGESEFAFPEETRRLREAAATLLERIRPSQVIFDGEELPAAS